MKKLNVKKIATKNTLRLAVLNAVILMWLGGCASNSDPTPLAPPSTPADNSVVQNNWLLSGKIGLVYPENGCSGGGECGNKSDQGKINWQQKGQQYNVKLSDPFNRVLMTIEGDEKMLNAKSPEQNPIQATPNEFVAIMVGNSGNVALSQLSPTWLGYWVTGRPAPGSAVTEKKDNEFVQQGYRVSSKRWKETAVGKMPSLIVVKKDRFTLRLAVQAWQAIE